MTNSQVFELYIYMENYIDGSIKYAHYDSFKVGSEGAGFRLASLGKYTGNVLENLLALHEINKFSTFDRDNDLSDTVNCSRDQSGGWWFGDCGYW